MLKFIGSEDFKIELEDIDYTSLYRITDTTTDDFIRVTYQQLNELIELLKKSRGNILII